MPSLRPLLLTTVATTASALVLASCSLPFGGDEDAAREAARGLATRLGDARADDGAVAEALGDLADVPRTVRVDDVETDDGTAGATLTWRWSLAGRTWSYETTARLVEDGERWRWRPSAATLHPDLPTGGRLVLTRQVPERGEVLGSGGSTIVTERPVVRVGIDKTLVGADRARRSGPELARLLDLDPARLEQRVAQAGPRAFVEAVVLRQEDLTPALQRRVLAVRGAALLRTTRPLAPDRRFAAALLGAVGPATAELVQDSDGRIAAGDLTGLSGLQRRYDEQLSGRAGVVVAARAAGATDGAEDRELFGADAVAGEDLRLTLDVDDQRAAEAALAEVEPAAAIVSLDLATGDVLASATGPGGGGTDAADTGRYPPGSTFKIVSALALLRSGLAPDDPVPCTRTVTVDGRSFENYDDYPAADLGRIPLARAFASSCNTAFIAERDRLGGEDLARAAASLGLGVDQQVGFASFFGQVPAASGATDGAASMIGQGRVLASPLSMATVAASVRSGRTVVPHLVADAPRPRVSSTLTAAEARDLQGLMRGVVTDGSGAFLAGVEPDLGAKTGTAEFGDDDPPRTHAWMVATDGRRAVAVFVAEGESGSRTAGPVLERYLRATR